MTTEKKLAEVFCETLKKYLLKSVKNFWNFQGFCNHAKNRWGKIIPKTLDKGKYMFIVKEETTQQIGVK